jgi:hypothetical protein
MSLTSKVSKTKTVIFTQILSAGFIVPTSTLDGWTQLQFNKIPANTVSVKDGKIHAAIKSSASPLIYRLPTIQTVTGLSWKVKVSGNMKSAEKAKKDAFEEDSYLRVGLVAAGAKKLGRLQRLVAPKWVKQLFDLSPPNVGLDKIYFFNLSQNPSLLNQSRNHPKSELMTEKVIAIKQTDVSEVNSEVNVDFPTPLPVAALWLSMDGDDTKSEFEVTLDEIVLKIPASAPTKDSPQKSK